MKNVVNKELLENGKIIFFLFSGSQAIPRKKFLLELEKIYDCGIRAVVWRHVRIRITAVRAGGEIWI